MIRYALRCAEGHLFESWFPSAEGYEKVKALGGLSCAICGSSEVEKTLMAPSLGAGTGKEDAPAKAEAPAPMLSAPGTPLEAAIRALRDKVEANADDVGRDFANLARKMHEGEIEDRPIYGEATRDEARSLLEDGVPVAPLPWRSGGN